MLLGFGTLVVLILAAGFALGVRSQGMSPAAGLQHGELQPCPDSPNCVCSEVHASRQPQHGIAPLAFHEVPVSKAWATLQQVVKANGGVIDVAEADYLHATFTSRLFRFVDDVEARPDAGVIQIRSASRVGRSDLGVNRRRVEAIRHAFEVALKAPGRD